MVLVMFTFPHLVKVTYSGLSLVTCYSSSLKHESCLSIPLTTQLFQFFWTQMGVGVARNVVWMTLIKTTWNINQSISKLKGLGRAQSWLPSDKRYRSFQ